MGEYFEEEQKIDTIWPLSILALISVINYFIYFHFGEKDLQLFYSSMIAACLISGLLLLLKLSTKIDINGIRYRLFPFQIKWRTINWTDIQKTELRTYRPIKEFGGWGLRFGMNCRACIIKGNEGLQLYLKDDKKLLLGTQKPGQLKDFLIKIGR